jgi:hypothetical protein
LEKVLNETNPKPIFAFMLNVVSKDGRKCRIGRGNRIIFEN